MTPEPPPIPQSGSVPREKPELVWGFKPWAWPVLFCGLIAAAALWEAAQLGSQGAAINVSFVVILGIPVAVILCCVFLAIDAILRALPARRKVIICLEALSICTFIAISMAQRAGLKPSAEEYFHWHTGAHLPITAQVTEWGAVRGMNEGWGFIELRLSEEDVMRVMSAFRGGETAGPMPLEESIGGSFERAAKEMGLKMRVSYPAQVWFVPDAPNTKLRTGLDAIWFPEEQRAIFHINWW